VGASAVTIAKRVRAKQIARSGDVRLPGRVGFGWWNWVKERRSQCVPPKASPVPVNNQLSRTDRTVLKTEVTESDSEASKSKADRPSGLENAIAFRPERAIAL